VTLLKTALFDLNAGLVDANYLHITLVVVGGAHLVLRGLRHASNDIDTALYLEEKTKEIIKVVGRKHNLSVEWLNDHVCKVLPANFDILKCTSYMSMSHVEVLLPSLDVIFIMKLKADREVNDRPDMRNIWPYCSFKTAHEVLLAFQLAWPYVSCGDHMEKYIQTIIDAAAPKA
jgi:hypothetical protein